MLHQDPATILSKSLDGATGWAVLLVVFLDIFQDRTPSVAFAQKRGSATMTSSWDYIQAAKNLCWHLQNGVVGSGPTRIKISGDTTLLPRAKGLKPLERRMAWAQHFLAKRMSGTQQVRQLMGHRQFGARVCHGDCIFFTISPNPQMSALVLKLSRYRESDPYIKHGSETARRLARQDYPRLEAKRARTVPVRPETTNEDKDSRQEDNVEIELPIPDYDERLTATARDPLAIVEAYRVEVILRLASILGVRMCPNCPRCNDSEYGCQDLFGANMRPVGGVLGGMSAFGGGTEHQGHGTPHLHAEGHVVCVYQYGTLQEVAEKISNGFLDVKSFTTYNDWLHHTDVLDEGQHTDFKERVDEEFDKRFAGREHDAMCTTPAYLADDASSDARATLADAHAGSAEMETLETEGASYRKAYLQDAQYVFSRVQHHVHRRTKHGYVPLSNCAKKTKTKGKETVCRAEFPMKKLCIDAPVCVCRGMAKKLGLRVSGRRNALGKAIGRRRCEWQSGTAPAFAVLFRSNSHTAPNYRVPLMAKTHDDEACPSKTCAAWARDPKTSKILSKLAQRAQREATGYYCGYTFKRQPVGTKYLRTIGESLNYMTAGMQDKTSGQKWHRITHRILTEFQHRIVARTAPEEWNLASRWHDQDPTVAEFMRTYMSAEFPGGQLVQRLEMEEKQLEQRDWQKVLPTAHGRGSGPEDLLKHFS